MHINIAILEDNHIDYNILKQQLLSWANNNHILNILWFNNSKSILEHDINFDLLFADIELSKDPPSEGLLASQALRHKGYTGEIVFLTAFSEYVFEGYDVHAFNYLLKPVKDIKIKHLMDKYVIIHTKDYYYLQKNSDIIQIQYNDIVCINREKNNVVILTLKGTYYERISLSEIETKLPGSFIRCHKSSIVNIKHIMSIAGDILHLSNRLTQKVGRKYINSIKKALLDIASI